MQLKSGYQFLDINESPLFFYLNPDFSPDDKEIPISIYESEMREINRSATLLFVTLDFKITTVSLSLMVSSLQAS